jgi:oligoribonuclease NrnB/cAMP/cGMP phosphodiesterase (DHH superfamily)
MIDKKDLEVLKKEIEESTNPLFLFDNDPDGFCSGVILLKNFGKGNAFPIKSFPNIDDSLLEKIERFSPDKIFILDKPFIDENFFDLMNEKGIEVFIIDHHEIFLTEKLKSKAKFFSSYPLSEPTSFICQKICNNKSTEWISLIGCIYDVFLPDFIQEFQESYPEMIDSSIEISKIRYSSELGKITLILSLALKASNQTIQNMIELFLKASGPNAILIEDEQNRYLHRRYNQLNKIIERNVEKTKVYGDLVYLEYSGEYSLSSDIANFLFFKYPDSFIVVCYKKYDAINISFRGEGSKSFTKEVVEKFEHSTGGGHELACGLRITRDSFDGFKKMVFEKFGVEKA